MALLIECPKCHRKQKVTNKKCTCGTDMDKAKKAVDKEGKPAARYYIAYYLHGKLKREYAGHTIKAAQDAHAKRHVQKAEKRFLDMLPGTDMTFTELTEWYLEKRTVKNLRSFRRVKAAITNFNKVFGHRIVGDIKQQDLEEYQGKRLEDQKKAKATIDYELSVVKTMVSRAIDNDKLDANTLKAFRKNKKLLKFGANARDRILSVQEYLNLLNASPDHLKAILVVAYNTGMRRGELLGLRWDQVDMKKRMITLAAEDTKEAKPKRIPINHHVFTILESLKAVPIIRDGKRVSNVFTFQGEPITDNFRKSLVTACKNAKIPFGEKVPGGFRWHDTRTSVKTNMLRAGVDKALRDVILGHALQGMDRYYIKPTDEDLHQAMERYTRWLDDQIAMYSPSHSPRESSESVTC